MLTLSAIPIEALAEATRVLHDALPCSLCLRATDDEATPDEEGGLLCGACVSQLRGDLCGGGR